MNELELRLVSLCLGVGLASLVVSSLRSTAAWMIAGAALVFLRPQYLGGTTQIVFVTGVSMEPAMRTGDLALLVRQRRYESSDVVAYRPSGSTDGLIIHRIVGGDASGYVIRGDNRPTDDYDRPTASELVGKAVLVLPSVGWFFAGLRVPVLLGFVVALVAMWFAWDILDQKKEEGVS